MKISILGSGYVGLVTGTCLGELGNDVILVDVEKEKVDAVNKGISPIYEKDLDKLLKKNVKFGRLKATLDLNVIRETELTFICVGTPEKEDGSMDLKYVKSAAEEIGKLLKRYHVIVVKSTVIPGTTENVVIPALERSGKKAGKDFGIVVNPEFLREGEAIYDFMNPDRIVIGTFDNKSFNVVNKLYENFDCPVLKTDLKTAEMIKYASNAFLATKISFANEIGNICKKLGIDVYKVMEGVGLDRRISPHFLNAGAGFGGSCLAKDVKALIAKAKGIGHEPILLDSVLMVNKEQPLKLVEIAKTHLGSLKNKKIAVLGLAFKPGTDDIREAPALIVIRELLGENAIIKVYDPKAMDNVKKIFKGSITYCKSAEKALENTDCCLIVTDWEDFKNPKIYSVMDNKLVIDGRKTLEPKEAEKQSIEYERVC